MLGFNAVYSRRSVGCLSEFVSRKEKLTGELVTKNQTWADCHFTYHDEGATATWVPAFLFGTVTIFFAMRLLTKWLRMGTWGWDDWTISFAYVSHES